MKIRWRLTVDSAEKSALTSIAAGYSNVTITVTQAIGRPLPPTYVGRLASVSQRATVTANHRAIRGAT